MTRRLVAAGRLGPASAEGILLRFTHIDPLHPWPACRICHRIFEPLDGDLCHGCRDELAHALDERRTAALYEAGADVRPEPPTRLADVLPFRLEEDGRITQDGRTVGHATPAQLEAITRDSVKGLSIHDPKDPA